MKRERFWVALDVDTRDQAETVMKALPSHRDYKVGMQLFYRVGPSVIRQWVDQGFRIFLDLKLYDIPNTVAQAVRAVDGLGVELLTVHAFGGPAMLAAARQEAGSVTLIAVTVVTSADQATLSALGIGQSVSEQVLLLTKLARDEGAGGVVVSGHELSTVAQAWPGARLVVPGIRFGQMPADDQVRVIGPLEARRAGATDLVIGRAVTKAEDPRVAYAQLLSLWDNADNIK